MNLSICKAYFVTKLIIIRTSSFLADFTKGDVILINPYPLKAINRNYLLFILKEETLIYHPAKFQEHKTMFCCSTEVFHPRASDPPPSPWSKKPSLGRVNNRITVNSLLYKAFMQQPIYFISPFYIRVFYTLFF